MLKHLKLAAAALIVAAGFASCGDDDPAPAPQPQPGDEWKAFIINQGNMGTVDGTVSAIGTDGSTVTAAAFYATNQQSLGDSPQAAVRYGSKIYVPVYGSNKLWVLDARSLRIVHDITVSQPEAVCGGAGYVFVAGNDGQLTRLDTLQYQPTQLAVGPNPAGVAYNEADGNVYVTISDGYNYANGYADGKKVAVVRASDLSFTRNIAVGTNPGQILATPQGNVYVVARGDYYLEPARVQCINAATGDVTDVANGQLIALGSGNVLYVVDFTADYTNDTCAVSSAAYSTTTGALVSGWQLDQAHLPGMPQAIDVDPSTGDIYVSSDPSPMGYTLQGAVYVYNRQGTHLRTLEAGIHPFSVVFK